MRITILTTSFPRSLGDPSGHFVAAEARALSSAGHHVRVIAPGRGAPMAGLDVCWIGDLGAFGWPGALSRLRDNPARALGVARFVHAARRVLAASPCDRLIASWIVPCGWPLALASDAPLEVVAHGSDVRLLLAAPLAFRRHVIETLLDRGARFRFVSSALRDALVRASEPRLRARSHVEPPTLDVHGTPERSRARAELAVEADRRLIVLACRLVASKRVDVALSALTLLPDARIVVLGDGPERRALARRFPEVELVGAKPRHEALSWLAAADLVVSASRDEGAPSVLREARALGVPVVSAAAGDLASLAHRDPHVWVVS